MVLRTFGAMSGVGEKEEGGIGLDREGGIGVAIVGGVHKMVDTGREPLVPLFPELQHFKGRGGTGGGVVDRKRRSK